MSEKAENTSNPLDLVKWLLVIVLLGGLVYAYGAYEDVSVLYRALGAVAIVAISLGIAATTAKGSAFLVFAKDSRTEVRKVIWPDRTEANRMTLIILVATAIVGLFLYLIDMFIVWGIGLFTGIGG
ncbi:MULTISPECIES: preprotein translocase subunit SecE [Alteromonadaceae]|jgi:preprotein translocase subunit SecE|uniref:Protein translocase subunit SecE n=1 Tax=Brumicola blandensis TaxID=3075611 RepID=A0AAW8R2C3_9ALTE|nr:MULTISPECIES: preprotein translocase subunit SecE [unclassified Alteromonas]MDT0583578.1 preprotein translocase subunit SecE [Alteromonas sp. W409]MDT0629972.1 preprotein translocase subunit SecE [Alteromonas sp. W364]